MTNKSTNGEWEKIEEAWYEMQEGDIMTSRARDKVICDWWKDKFQQAEQKGYQRGKDDALETPMGVSQWKNHGIKYKYFDFFEDKSKQDTINKIREWADKNKLSEELDITLGEHAYPKQQYNKVNNIVLDDLIQFLNKIK